MSPAAAVVIATLMREAGGSGVQSHVATLRAHLAGAERSCSLVTPFTSKSPSREPVFAGRRLVERVNSEAGVWWYRRWHHHYLHAGLAAELAKASSRTTVYAQCPVSAHAALRARSTQPVVLVVHFNISQADEWVAKGAIPAAGRLYHSIARFEEYTLPRLDGLVYVSDFMRAALEKRIPAVRPLPSVVVPNCVAVSPWRATATPTSRDLVTIGSLEPRKNHTYLLQVLAAAALMGHRYTLTIVGEGPHRARLERAARELGIADLVEFAGYQRDPRALLRQHRLYCHVSTMESFGIVLLEAMAEGLPLLAGSVGGIPEILQPGINGECWPLDDPSAAAHQLVQLMSDRGRRRSMGRSGFELARDRFSTMTQIPRLLEFLDSVHEG